MIRLGLTGGVGMGKSTTAAFLTDAGATVIDTDLLAREIVEPGEPALAEVVRLFGPGVVGGDGRLERRALANIIFADPTQRQRLESLLHPRIRALWLDRLRTLQFSGVSCAVVVIPLLYETGATAEFDFIVCTACSRKSQEDRLGQRGLGAKEIEQRISAQAPLDLKLTQSHFVIWTEGSLDLHREQVNRVLRSIRQLAA